MMKKIYILISMILAVSSIEMSGQNIPAFIKDSLDKYITREMSEWQIPGIAVCIVKDGKVHVMKGYGVCEYGKNDKVDENTLFVIGSNTKAFTATALSNLAFENKCSLEDKVIKWVPEFQSKDKIIEQNATLTDILSHRMGYGTFQGDFMLMDSDLSPDEMIKKFGMIEPENIFRDTWGYCNFGYMIAGQCIENISGQNWQDYVNDNIFKPLKMNNTISSCCGILQVSNKAIAHTVVNNEIKVVDYSLIDNIGPAGCISSSIENMSHWLIAQLDKGKYENQQAIPYQVIQETWKPRSIIGNVSNREHSNFMLYGLGWILQDYEGREIVYHTGGTTGFVTSVTLVPSENLGIIIFTNSDYNEFYEAFKWSILDAYFGLPIGNYSAWWKPCFDQRQQKKELQIKTIRDSVNLKLTGARELKEYTGTYTHPVYGNIYIALKKDYLLVTFEHHPSLTATLERISGDRFLVTYNQPLFGTDVSEFQCKENGNKKLPLKIADMIEHGIYIFDFKTR